MVEPLRHRQTKGAETDMPGLPPPRHIPTLPTADVQAKPVVVWRPYLLGCRRPGVLACQV